MSTFRRRLAREKALQVLFSYEVSKEPLRFIEDQQLTQLQEKPAEFIFAIELIRLTTENAEELDTWIKTKIQHWEFQRLAMVDKIALRIAICELLYFPEIPAKVTLNEAIEIVKLFSTDKSGQFVNGVLDSILQDMKTKKLLKKTGRGVLENGVSPQEMPTPSPHREKAKSRRSARSKRA
jgi:N utilization substance protein B